MTQEEALHPLIWVAIVMIIIIIPVVLGIIPSVLGIKEAKSKGISPHWLWFGLLLIPIGSWITYLIIRFKVKPRSGSHNGALGNIPPSGTSEHVPATGRESITFRVKDEDTARSLCNDQYFLFGALRADSSLEATRFLNALRRGSTYRYEVRRNSISGECEVKMWIR